MTLSFWDFVIIALIVRGPELLALAAKLVQFWERVDIARYALACDDEACEHYKETPCSWFRAKLATKAFLLNKWPHKQQI
ncbi:hypothetical protein [Rheinheimera hassiensis]|uniref:hypothetical protein n=1 Tax=Rheinheimera hassiensis TaxID=1193627 RepID=UPI001F053554|nr:hypothetical protein [Rheinheimera hassiensis]